VALITAIAYDVERDLGRAYNATMERLRPGDWGCFLDHDALFTTRSWYPQILEAIAANPNAGLITGMTNRIGRKTQISKGCPTGHDIREHFAFGAAQKERYGSTVIDVTNQSPISGVLMALSRETWERMGRFKSGFFGVDNSAHRDVAKFARVFMMPGLYLYHWYRGDGVGHPGAPKASRG
jgi:GT2 family glycosyltransferase